MKILILTEGTTLMHESGLGRSCARDHLPDDALKLKPAVESLTHTPAGEKVRTGRKPKPGRQTHGRESLIAWFQKISEKGVLGF
jgi:hypothetical protein